MKFLPLSYRVIRAYFTVGAIVWLAMTPLEASAQQSTYANPFDTELKGVFEARERDWRNGALVYQVMVDRFAPSNRLEEKRALYPSPKVLHNWNEDSKRGDYRADLNLWSHEIDFWGGDLQSVRNKLDYLQELGVDVLYLNPIHLAYTSHKYDALDYLQVSPEFGTRQSLKELANDLHHRRMKLVLDGVFNHMGRHATIFEKAEADLHSPYRNWFYFGTQYPGGARGWYQATNLPELNLENPRVREHIYGQAHGVVQSYLHDGADGWRLDVAPELGPRYLAELTQAAHRAKPGALVLGETPNYPKEWFPALDGVINFTLRDIVFNTLGGLITAPMAAQMIDRTVAEAGIEPMLKSWFMLDNHDNPRLANVLPDLQQRRLAQLLQFTLPGSPNLYYGTELGMTGAEDPANRSPMRWDLVTQQNPDLIWTQQLIALRKQHRALRVGNFRIINSSQLLAFERYTDRVKDAVLVLVNPGKTAVTERVLIANSKLMNGSLLRDLVEPNTKPVAVLASMATVNIPANSFRVLTPDVQTAGGYTPYKRVQ